VTRPQDEQRARFLVIHWLDVDDQNRSQSDRCGASGGRLRFLRSTADAALVRTGDAELVCNAGLRIGLSRWLQGMHFGKDGESHLFAHGDRDGVRKAAPF